MWLDLASRMVILTILLFVVQVSRPLPHLQRSARRWIGLLVWILLQPRLLS